MNATPNPYIEEGLVKTNNAIAMDQNNLNSVSDFLNKKIAEFLKLPDGQTLENLDWSNIGNIISIISGIFITVSLTVFVLWLIRAIGLYIMSKNRGDKLAFFGFIPYACLYTMGKIVGRTKIFGIEISHPEYILPLIVISMQLPFAAPIGLFLFVLVYNTLLYRIYQEQCRNFAVILTVFSFFLPFIQPFIIFLIRNKKSDKIMVQKMENNSTE